MRVGLVLLLVVVLLLVLRLRLVVNMDSGQFFNTVVLAVVVATTAAAADVLAIEATVRKCARSIEGDPGGDLYSLTMGIMGEPCAE